WKAARSGFYLAAKGESLEAEGFQSFRHSHFESEAARRAAKTANILGINAEAIPEQHSTKDKEQKRLQD
nr:hypothetical protein [Tanacetum cinerariifolium]